MTEKEILSRIFNVIYVDGKMPERMNYIDLTHDRYYEEDVDCFIDAIEALLDRYFELKEKTND